MARKARRVGRATGYNWIASSGSVAHADTVVIEGEITELGPDHGRPVMLLMTPADARRYAAGLVQMADAIERRQAKGDA